MVTKESRGELKLLRIRPWNSSHNFEDGDECKSQELEPRVEAAKLNAISCRQRERVMLLATTNVPARQDSLHNPIFKYLCIQDMPETGSVEHRIPMYSCTIQSVISVQCQRERVPEAHDIGYHHTTIFMTKVPKDQLPLKKEQIFTYGSCGITNKPSYNRSWIPDETNGTTISLSKISSIFYTNIYIEAAILRYTIRTI